jgi:hypothetical protein
LKSYQPTTPEVAGAGNYRWRLFGASATVDTAMAVSALAGAVDGDDVRAIGVPRAVHDCAGD